jgi:U3 small nucleolar RNA-associated protein 14
MSDEKQQENGTAMEETTAEQELQETAEKKSKSPSNSQESHNSESENDEDQELPFPGFTAKSKFFILV